MLEGVVPTPGEPIALALPPGSAALEIDTSIYHQSAVLRACYKLTDRCYFFLARRGEASLVVTLLSKSAEGDLSALIGELCNELLDQQLRHELAIEAGPVRELIVAQAFAEGNLLDPQRDEGDYVRDPLGIGEDRGR
jgi:His-Xaa-Ser system protein HxsD